MSLPCFPKTRKAHTEFSPSFASCLPRVYLKFVLRLPVKSDDLVFLQAIFLSEIAYCRGSELFKAQFYLNGQEILFYLDDKVYFLLVFRPPVID